MNKNVKSLILLLLVFLSSCTTTTNTPTPTPELEAVTLKLSWHHGVQFLGFYVAQERGYYADEGLIVEIDSLLEASENTTIPARVADGEFDFSLAGLGRLGNQQAEGIAVTTIATILQLSPISFFARSDSGIITPADLAGQRIAVNTKSSRGILEELLHDFDLTLDDVELVEISFDMTPFFEGEVDVWTGFLTNEVVRARQRGLEIITLPLYEYGIRSTSDTIFTRQEIVQDNPDLATKFLRASLRGWQWAIENPTEAVDLILERFPELADERDFHLAAFNAYIPLIQVPGVPIGTIDCERWLSDERFEALDSIENLCTTEIFEQAVLDD